MIEERYTLLLQSLPGRIEEAEEAIRETLATQRMLGYTFVVSFALAATLDTLALLLISPKSLSHALTLVLTDKSFHGFLHWVWWYAFGYSGMVSFNFTLLTCQDLFLIFSKFTVYPRKIKFRQP